jgi:hypothetical protein
MKCPASTQDVKLNLKNRDWAFKNVGYGPANPEEESPVFWAERAKEWNTTEDEAKSMRCGNCAAFIVTPEMEMCIVNGMGSGTGGDEYEAIADAADLGYCELFEFKCAGSRVCSAYLVGGPITKILTKQQKQTLAMAKLEYETAEKKYEDLKESLLGKDED